MSAIKFVTFEVCCDVKVASNCAEGYEGLPGKTLKEVRADAESFGWSRVRVSGTARDVCPACTKRLSGEAEEGTS